MKSTLVHVSLNEITVSFQLCTIFIHGFLPDAIMITIIAPIIKNKAGDLSDNNYRPIALATIASKLFESLILSRVSTFLSTCVNQFGFKKHHSTEMLIFLLKELFRHYIANGSSMYVTMLDASKAFDKVNHSKLFTKLIVLLLLFAFFITGTEPRNSLSDGVVASQNFLPFQTVLSRVESFLHIFLTFTWMT